MATKADDGLVARAISVMLVMPECRGRKKKPTQAPNHKHTSRNENKIMRKRESKYKKIRRKRKNKIQEGNRKSFLVNLVGIVLWLQMVADYVVYINIGFDYICVH